LADKGADAPKEYGPHKTIYNRFVRWSRLGVFNRIFAALAAIGGNSSYCKWDNFVLHIYHEWQGIHTQGQTPRR